MSHYLFQMSHYLLSLLSFEFMVKLMYINPGINTKQFSRSSVGGVCVGPLDTAIRGIGAFRRGPS